MFVTVFRSRLNLTAQQEYFEWAARMGTLAQQIPGYRTHKSFAAEDGERVTVVEFETEESLRIWATHPDHMSAKKIGRESFFSEYRVQICHVVREKIFPVQQKNSAPAYQERN